MWGGGAKKSEVTLAQSDWLFAVHLGKKHLESLFSVVIDAVFFFLLQEKCPKAEFRRHISVGLIRRNVQAFQYSKKKPQKNDCSGCFSKASVAVVVVSSKQFMNSFSQSSSAFLFDVDLFICVRLHVLQPVCLSVHYLIGSFHEPGECEKEMSFEIL